MRTGTAPLRVLGYCRVSTEEQASSGLGLAAQRAVVQATCSAKGWTLVDVVVDAGASGKDLERPGIRRVLEAIASGEVEGVVVAKLDRLSRSLADLVAVAEWLTDAGAVLVAVDLGVDTTSPNGRLVLHVLGAMGEWERGVIRERTVDALAARRAEGRPISGPSVVDRPELAGRIAARRAEGATYQAIADELNAQGVPTLRGGSEWRVSSVQAATGYRRPPRKRRPPELPALPRRRRAARGAA